MDQKELIDRLRRDPKAVQSLMTSADGQRLMQLLSGGDGGRTLQQAAGEAAAGNTLQMAQMLKSIMSTPEDRPAAAHPGQSAGIERRTAVCQWTRN